MNLTDQQIQYTLYNNLFLFLFMYHLNSEKADLKSRSDSTSGGPHLDSIYTTPSGFHHHHAERPGSPEAMKVRMAAMILQPPTRV